MIEADILTDGKAFRALYESPEAVEQRLLHGANVFRLWEDGTVELVPFEKWPDTKQVQP